MNLRPRIFADRAAAGIALGQELQKRLLTPPVVVFGLPRGGVLVAYEVARILEAPLDIMLVRKIGLPGQPELAMGALASGGIVVHETAVERAFPDLAMGFGILAREQRAELERLERIYRRGLAPLELMGTTAILVDDGLATGSTMLAAVRAARKAGAGTTVIAAPVASSEAAALLRAEADALVILQTPPALLAIGQWYRNSGQLNDAEVCRLLGRSHSGARRSSGTR